MKLLDSHRDTPVKQGVALSRKGRCRLTDATVNRLGRP